MIDFLSEKFDYSKPIRFVIPSYQRGYRWREDDVEKLLKDLATYSGNSYCLQPLELQLLEKGNWPKWISEKSDCSNYIYYRVVDGQQRLTTVFIISKILDLNISWEICYNTEQKLLSEILTKEIEDITINDFFRKQVYGCAYKYIVNHPEIKQNLLNYFGPCNENNKIVFPIHFLDSDPNIIYGQ